jgi:hypothetical protein
LNHAAPQRYNPHRTINPGSRTALPATVTVTGATEGAGNAAEGNGAATDKSVKGITTPGPCWAVDVKVERSNSVRLREGSITHYWGTKQDADADAPMITEGNHFYKDTGRH